MMNDRCRDIICSCGIHTFLYYLNLTNTHTTFPALRPFLPIPPPALSTNQHIHTGPTANGCPAGGVIVGDIVSAMWPGDQSFYDAVVTVARRDGAIDAIIEEDGRKGTAYVSYVSSIH